MDFRTLALALIVAIVVLAVIMPQPRQLPTLSVEAGIGCDRIASEDFDLLGRFLYAQFGVDSQARCEIVVDSSFVKDADKANPYLSEDALLNGVVFAAGESDHPGKIELLIGRGSLVYSLVAFGPDVDTSSAGFQLQAVAAGLVGKFLDVIDGYSVYLVKKEA